MDPTTLRDASRTAEAAARPARLAFKDSHGDESPVGQMLALDTAEGIVTAIVSVTGIEDEVNDIIVPGAYKSTLSRRRPKVCWAHSWDKPVGRVLHIEELMPGDPRLPVSQKDGSPWPREAGALVATMQFNMASKSGSEAFEAVRFYSETGECEYCVDDETEILTGRGWLRYDQVTTDDLAYVLDPETQTARFEPIKAVHVWPKGPRMMRSIRTSNHSSMTTLAHRWPVQRSGTVAPLTWTDGADLDHRDRIFRAAARDDAPTTAKWSDALVELLGWYWTEGWLDTNRAGNVFAHIGQSQAKNPAKVAAIRAALGREFPGDWTERAGSGGMVHFRLRRGATDTLLALTTGHKVPTAAFLTDLTAAQARLLIETCIDGDGHRAATYTRWYQKDPAGADAFQMLCALAGVATNAYEGTGLTNVTLGKHRMGKPVDATRVKGYNYTKGPQRTVAHNDLASHDGIVWCPETPSGTWLARREGTVYFTGNSIGYQVPPGRSVKDKGGTRHIKALELYELSVVLFGAHTMTGTLSIKAAFEMASEGKHLRSGVPAGIDLEALEAKDVGPTPDSVAEHIETGVMVAVYPDPAAKDAVAAAIAGPDDVTDRDDLHVTLAYLGTTGDVTMPFDDIVAAVTAACAGEDALDGVVGGIGMFPPDDDGQAATWAPVDVLGLGMLREAIVAGLGDAVATDHGFTPHMTLGYGIGLIDPVPATPVTFGSVRVVYGQQTADVGLGGRLSDEGKALPVGSRLPVDVFDDPALVADTEALLAAGVAEAKAVTPGGRVGDASPVGTPGGRQNWVDKAGGLPRYIRMVAHALIREGHSKSSAIAIAVATMKRWARGGGDVTPKVQAAAAKAVAEWETMRARAAAEKAVAYDPSLDAAPVLGKVHPTGGVKRYPRLPGSMEEWRDLLDTALRDALGGVRDDDGKPEWPDVSIDATFDDHVIVTRRNWETEDRETYRVGYTVVSADEVVLGSWVPVTLEVAAVAVDDDVPWGDLMPLAEDVERVTSGLKSLVGGEVKAGRVLSGANEQQLRVAVGNLLAVLAAAGVRVEGTMDVEDDELPGRVVPNSRRRGHRSTEGGGVAGDRRVDVDPAVDLTTTSPSATTKAAGIVLEVADVQSVLARLLD